MCSKAFSTLRGIFVVVTTIVAFGIPGNSFVDHALKNSGESTYSRKTEFQVFDSKIGKSEPSISTVSSVEEALSIIESRGDKRFLHAVVASDYKFLYEQSKTVPSEIDAEQIFSKKVPSSSNRQKAVELASTGNLVAKKSPSLWPLESSMTSGSDIHFAWPEQGGILQSNKPKDDSRPTQKMIVDGIDCGKMSLEDALEGNMQVLVQAPTYLSVPSHMESSLRKGLQGAFLI